MMITIVLVAMVVIVAVDCFLTVRLCKELSKLIDDLRDQTHTKTNPLDRAKAKEIEYRNKNNNNWPKID